MKKYTKSIFTSLKMYVCHVLHEIISDIIDIKVFILGRLREIPIQEGRREIT